MQHEFAIVIFKKILIRNDPESAITAGTGGIAQCFRSDLPLLEYRSGGNDFLPLALNELPVELRRENPKRSAGINIRENSQRDVARRQRQLLKASVMKAEELVVIGVHVEVTCGTFRKEMNIVPCPSRTLVKRCPFAILHVGDAQHGAHPQAAFAIKM